MFAGGVETRELWDDDSESDGETQGRKYNDIIMHWVVHKK